MQTKDLILHYGRQWQIIKQVCQFFPNFFRTKLFIAFLVKPIYLSDSSGLMVSSGQCDSIWISYLVSKQETDSLD